MGLFTKWKGFRPVARSTPNLELFCLDVCRSEAMFSVTEGLECARWKTGYVLQEWSIALLTALLKKRRKMIAIAIQEFICSAVVTKLI
jgi:hypothetical protein